MLEGAGDGAALSNLTASPVLGSLMIRPAFFFFCGIWNWFDFGAGLCVVCRLEAAALLTAGVLLPAGGLPMLELGRSECDIADDVRDIGEGWP